MKCHNCGADNDSSAKYCRECGSLLKIQSIIEQYPEYSFQPTTTFTLKGNKGWWLVIVPLIIVFLYALFFTGGSIFYEGLVRGNSAFAFIGGGAGIIVAIVSYVLIKKCYRKTKPINISDDADYIEGISKNGNYSIIVKNGLWGLYDSSHHVVQIPCQYASLKWDRKGSTLRATKNNVNFLIDIYNNKLK